MGFIVVAVGDAGVDSECRRYDQVGFPDVHPRGFQGRYPVGFYRIGDGHRALVAMKSKLWIYCDMRCPLTLRMENMLKTLKRRRIFVTIIALVLYHSLSLIMMTEAYAGEASWHASGASAHVWRGISRHDNVTIGSGVEFAAHGFRTRAWAFVRADELDAIGDQGLIAETQIDFMYRLPVRSYTLDLGYSEYMFNVGPENTREVFANLVLPFRRYVDVMTLLAYDVGVHEDYYLRSGLRVHGEIFPSFTAFGEAAMAAAGNGFSIGPKGGMHDYGFKAGLSHEINQRLRWGVDMQWTGSLDHDVLPKQRVISLLTFRLAVDI